MSEIVLINQQVELKNRRHALRAPVSGTVRLDGKDYPLIDWSNGGFLADNYRAAHRSGDRLEAHFSILLDDDPYDFDCKVFLVRIDEIHHNVAGVFIEMKAKDRLKVAQYLN